MYSEGHKHVINVKFGSTVVFSMLQGLLLLEEAHVFRRTQTCQLLMLKLDSTGVLLNSCYRTGTVI